jgi:hypothetical protein
LNVTDDARAGAEVAETTIKDFYAAGFGTLVKQWCKCINVGGGCQDIKVFSSFEYHVLHFISIGDLFTDSLSYSDFIDTGC